VAGGYARAAVQHGLAGRGAGQVRLPLAPQFLLRFEALVVGQVLLEPVVPGARDVTADFVDRFVLAAETVGSAGIDQQLCVSSRNLIHRHRPFGAGIGSESGRRGRDASRLQRAAFRHPACQSAIEDRDGVVTHEAQHPPQTRGIHAGILVVGHHLRRRPDSHGAESSRHLGHGRQRMAAVRTGLGAGQVAIEMCVSRAWNVPLEVIPLAAFGVCEIETAVDDDPA